MEALFAVAASIAGFLVILGPLIFVHEGGHFLVAKWMDIHVKVFSLGFGPRLTGWRVGETDYRISWVPWGGYVRMGGDTPGEPVTDPRSYLAKPTWVRLPVVLAGVTMNFLTAWAIFSFWAWWGIERETTDPVVRVAETSVGHAAGLRTGDRVARINGREVPNFLLLRQSALEAALTNPARPLVVEVDRAGELRTFSYRPDIRRRDDVWDVGFLEYLPAVVGSVMHGFPAYQAGLAPGDRIVSVDGKPVEWFSDLAKHIHGSIDRPIDVEVSRAGRVRKVRLVPKAQKLGDARLGMIGIQPAYRRRHRDSLGPVESFRAGLSTSTAALGATVGVLVSLAKREQDVGSTLGGPISIAAMAGRAVRGGLQDTADLIARLSIALVVFNILPIAPFDGGHIFFLIVETLRRKPLPIRAHVAMQNLGVALVLGLILVILYFDVSKIVMRQVFPQIQ